MEIHGPLKKSFTMENDGRRMMPQGIFEAKYAVELEVSKKGKEADENSRQQFSFFLPFICANLCNN
jgi:hypothetical protein